MGMAPFAVVERLDVIKYAAARLVTGSVIVVMDELGFQRMKEALGDSIVPATSLARHTALSAVVFLVAIPLALIRLYLSGHGLLTTEFEFDYGPIHLTIWDIVLLVVSFAVGLTTFIIFVRQDRKP